MLNNPQNVNYSEYWDHSLQWKPTEESMQANSSYQLRT